MQRWTPLAVLLGAGLAMAACVGPGGPGGDDDAGQPLGAASDPAARGDDGGTAGGGELTGGSADGPIRVTVDGVTYGYTAGRCEILDEVVYVTATTDDATGQFLATLPPWDHEIAHAQRDGSISATKFGSDGPGFELMAGRSQAGTTWDWSVSGSDVAVEAVMSNRADATGELVAVTIDIQCAGGTFGTSPYAGQFDEPFFPIELTFTRVPGSVTIDLEGSQYRITYLSHCQFFGESISAEGTADDATVYLYAQAGVHLDLLIGDRRAEEDGMRWSLLPEASLTDDFLFQGSDTVRSWSGPIVAADGSEAEVTITVECTEGDGLQSAGSGTLELDGTLYVLNQVTACSIDGTTIEFFGTDTESDVAIVVTGGGSQVLLGDETGRQTATFDIEFDVSGQQATWSGALAGERAATIAIDCG